MKKFKQLWYYGVSIVGIPVVLIIMATFFVIASNLNKSVNKAVEEEEVQPKVDTVIVEKRVIVKDTVYIPTKSKPTPVAPVKDTL
jgi:hypothetical protein